MSLEHYPADLPITRQDFADCGWKEVLSEASREGYSSMWQAFAAAARQAVDEGRPAQGKVLWLLADACSMMLSPGSLNEPFKPKWVTDGRRSVIPDDLPESDIAFFSDIAESIDDPRLKARLADLVWLKQRPRNVRFALAAIDSYRSISLDTQTWLHDGKECWERAIHLARMLKGGAGQRIKEVEAAVLGAFQAAACHDGFLGLWLADLLDRNGLGRDHAATLAQRLESLAREFDQEGNLHSAREYFDAGAKWYRRAGDDAKSAELTVALAEAWVKEAMARIASDNPSHMVAATFYEKAIQIYRSISRAERATHRVDERIAELRAHLNESGEKSLGEMGVFQSPEVDISELIEQARRAVQGKEVLDALRAFVGLHGGVNVQRERESAIKRMRRHPLQAIMSATVMSKDGRVIARRPAMSLDGSLTQGDETAIRAEMIRDFGVLIDIVVKGDIWPALEVLLLEHRLTEADFVTLARQSPIVPNGREVLFGKALFAGYERDFVTALHLLVPQIEHMVRFHLKQAGVKTTNLDINGIENENGLSTLMDLPEAEKIFGEDISFEIRALFCDAFGPNLRNELAHGLLDADACYSVYSIYAWWLALKLVFNTFWNAARKEHEGDANGA